jgi:hypothetical protein
MESIRHAARKGGVLFLFLDRGVVCYENRWFGSSDKQQRTTNNERIRSGYRVGGEYRG